MNVRDLYRREYDFEVPESRFVEVHSPDGTVIGELARLEANRAGTWEGADVIMSTLFDPIPSVHARGNTIAIATAREPEVLLLDDELRVRRIVRWSEPGETVDWWAFTPNGDFRCRLTNPSGLTIYEFGADYLLGVHTDDLGVERVVMYELGLPANPGEAGGG